jgi:V-type H+-transporting ATPase subunit E
MRFCEEANGL